MSDQNIFEKEKLDRRSMLKSGLMAVGAVSIGSLAACTAKMEVKKEADKSGGACCDAAAAANCKTNKCDTGNMNLSLAAYSFRDQFKAGELDVFGFIDYCAEMQIPGTELTSYYFKEGFDSAYLRELKRHAFRNGVTISGTAIANDFCKPAGAERDEEVKKVCEWIDNAVEMYAPHIRIFAGKVPDGVEKEQAITWCAEGIGECLRHAEERGVTLGLENHGGITALADDLLAIYNKVGEHPWFGINLDTGNFRELPPYEELAKVAPYAVNVQIKVEVTEDGKMVKADLGKFRDVLVAANYKGWVALEYEEDGDPKVRVPYWLDELKKIFIC